MPAPVGHDRAFFLLLFFEDFLHWDLFFHWDLLFFHGGLLFFHGGLLFLHWDSLFPVMTEHFKHLWKTFSSFGFVARPALFQRNLLFCFFNFFYKVQSCQRHQSVCDN